MTAPRSQTALPFDHKLLSDNFLWDRGGIPPTPKGVGFLPQNIVKEMGCDEVTLAGNIVSVCEAASVIRSVLDILGVDDDNTVYTQMILQK